MNVAMNTLVESLLAERRVVLEQLCANPNFKKLVKIDALLLEYGQTPDTFLATASTIPESSTGADTAAPAPMNPKSKEAKVRSAILDVLRAGPKHRKDILRVLEDIGLMGHEKTPLQSLAIYLSRWKDEIIGLGDGVYALRASQQGDIHADHEDTPVLVSKVGTGEATP